jgi:hypothetical protein
MGWIGVRDAAGGRGTQVPVDGDGGSGVVGTSVVDGGGKEGAIDGGAVGGRRRQRRGSTIAERRGTTTTAASRTVRRGALTMATARTARRGTLTTTWREDIDDGEEEGVATMAERRGMGWQRRRRTVVRGFFRFVWGDG